MKRAMIFLSLAVAALVPWLPARPARPEPASPPPAQAAVTEGDCFACHDNIEALKKGSRHASVNCVNCHTDTAAHLEDPSSLPGTRTDHAACGVCHKDQFESFSTFDYKKLARLEKSLPTERSPNPLWDKFMMGHGFTREHAAPRGHAFMLVDHLVVDRAYGGRFQPKDGWKYVTTKGAVKAWDVLEETQPDSPEHKSYLTGTGAAANATCLQCKSQDHILRWKYLGEKDANAKWDRTSNPAQVAKDLSHGLNCFYCHDPHGARPRVVRDGLIQALTRPEADTLWHKDEKRTKIEVVDFRDGFRKIALLEKTDTKLQCGQCHVEYNCNTGTNPKDGSKIGYDSSLTNHFPFKDVFSIYEHYENVGFRDFRHELTGGLLWKAQHPEAETFWNSKHDKAGVSCNDCHMPKVKNAKGKTFTSHWQTSPRNYLKETCLRCHAAEGMSEQDAIYQIDSVKSYVRGKMRKSEFWLAALIDKIVEARKAGLDESVIKQAQDQHQKAHILWEWWTAENSDGFHNPDAARRSLVTSIDESRKGIKLIDDAMQARTAAK